MANTGERNETHQAYDKFLPIWTEINDICDGEHLQKYLIKLNPLDLSDENVSRNSQYYDRAVFYAISGYTTRGMLGMLFRKEPSLSIDTGLEYIKDNIDGKGLSIYQQSQEVCKDLVKIGRCGLWVDFPQTDGNTSKADIDSLRIFATTKKFNADQIINWEISTFGAKIYLSKIVLSYEEERDGENIDVILELLMEENVYKVQKWECTEESAQWNLTQDYTPTDSTGATWDQIPFMFVGSETNTYIVDQPPSKDIVRVNIGHWNNSACYEDTLWFSGQVQPWMSGITEEYIKLLNDSNMYVGSGRLLGVPSGEQFGYAQSLPNSALKVAMSDKVDMMIGLGALFLQPGSAVKTATQSEGEKEISHSVLSLIASNASEAYVQVLSWMSRYMGTSEENIEYAITQEFVKPTATSADLKEIVASLLQGAIPFSDYVKWCQTYGYIDEAKTVEEISEELKATSGVPNLDEDEDEEDE